MGYKVHFINRVVSIVILLWSVIMLIAGSFLVYKNYSYADTLAKNEAVVSVKKDLATVHG